MKAKDKERENKFAGSFSLLTGLFFMWGLITAMNDILIPYLKGIFELSHFEALLVQTAFFGAYFVGSLIYFIISIISGDPINKIGYKNGIIIGLVISALGVTLFYPAAQYHSYAFFLAALFVLGLGFTMLQIAANPYVAVLGSEKTASSRLNMAQGFNSLGTFLAPLLGGLLIYQIFGGNESSGAEGVKIPYLVLGALFVAFALLIKVAPLPSFHNIDQTEKKFNLFKFPQLYLGIIAIFMYVGGEVSIGSMLTGFAGLPNIGGLAKEQAAIYVALYWGGLMIGRFTGSVSMSKLPWTLRNILMIAMPITVFLFMMVVFLLRNEIDKATAEEDFTQMYYYAVFLGVNILAFFLGKHLPARTLGIFAVSCAVLILIALLTEGKIALWALVATGLFNSIMWSNIFTLAIKGLGHYTGRASSLLIMAILGGALVPPLQGLLADNIGVHASFIVPFFCYVYLAFYSYKVKFIVKEKLSDNAPDSSDRN